MHSFVQMLSFCCCRVASVVRHQGNMLPATFSGDNQPHQVREQVAAQEVAAG
jgi:hypothetical protein